MFPLAIPIKISRKIIWQQKGEFSWLAAIELLLQLDKCDLWTNHTNRTDSIFQARGNRSIRKKNSK